MHLWIITLPTAIRTAAALVAAVTFVIAMGGACARGDANVEHGASGPETARRTRIDGVYELASVDGRPLPYAYQVQDATGPYEVVTYGRRYVLEGVRWHGATRLLDQSPLHAEQVIGEPRLYTDSGTITIAGDTLILRCVSAEAAAEEEPCLRGVVRGDTLRVAGVPGGSPSEVYVRRSGP